MNIGHAQRTTDTVAVARTLAPQAVGALNVTGFQNTATPALPGAVDYTDHGRQLSADWFLGP